MGLSISTEQSSGLAGSLVFFKHPKLKGSGHLSPPQLAGQQAHFLLGGERCDILETIPEYI